MKLLRSKVWNPWDVAQLKWSSALFGMILGAYFPVFVLDHVWWFVLFAVVFAIRPGMAYWRA